MSPPTPPSWEFVPDDLFTEFLSLLPVKSLLRFKCVSKSWNSLISDPNFVKFHLKKSKSHNPHFTLITSHRKDIKGESPYGSDDEMDIDFSIIPYPISSLLDNPSFTLFADHHYLLNEKDCFRMAGSCNGLICLTGERMAEYTGEYTKNEYWFRLWNPATRAISEKMGCFIDHRGFGFNFGCDNSTGTFKVVASRYNEDQLTSDVRVFSFDENVWRNIESFPVVPLDLTIYEAFEHTAVFFNGTLNWLAIRKDIPYTFYLKPKDLTVEQFVIVSLDLATETYNMYTLPPGFDEVPPAKPTVAVLGDCFCFSYPYKDTDFIIWKMKKFGMEESWTRFLKISYHDLQLSHDFSDDTMKYHLYFLPLFLSKDGDTLTLCSNQELNAILYNWRDHRVERTEVIVHKTIIDDETYNWPYWCSANSFVESLISIC